MANRSRRPYKPIDRTNQLSSSSSSSSTTTRPHNPKPANPNSNSPTISSNSENDYNDAIQDFPTLIGTCSFMCPVEEVARREKLRDLAVFERLHGDPAKTSPNLAVKKFCRTISKRDMQTSDVRPILVLEQTLDYVLSLLQSSDRPFEVVHDFIFDRTRSIRQDLSMQNVVGDQVIHMYEKVVKFHIISHNHFHRSCGTSYYASMSHLNMEQLMKTLMTLFNLYKANRDSNCVNKNEAEFHSLYLLLLLDSNNQGESLCLWFRRIPSLIKKSKEISFARRIIRYFRLGYYKRFIHTTEEEASYLQFCVIEPYINQVRIVALSYINLGGYKLQPYPLVHLSKLLMMKESDVESLCVNCGLEICTDETEKGLVSSKQPFIFKPIKGFQKYYPLDSERIERNAENTW